MAVFKPYILPQTVQQGFKLILIALVVLLLFIRLRIRRIWNPILPLCVSISISGVIAFLSGSSSVVDVLNGVQHAICLYLIWIVIAYCQQTDYYQEMVRCLYRITSVYCILSLISVALKINSGNKSEIVYFFGYKFLTSYFLIFWLGLYRILHQEQYLNSYRERIRFFLMALAILGICILLDCTTAIIAVIIVTAFLLLPEKIRRVFYSPVGIFIMLIAAGVYPFFIDRILQIPFVQYVVTELFHRNMNLTGRVAIYRMLGNMLLSRRWFGYGYGVGDAMILTQLGYGNAQDGILQHFLAYGIVGTVIFALLMYRCVRRYDQKMEGWYIILISLIICSFSEVAFNYIFYMVLTVIGVFQNDIDSIEQMPMRGGGG